MAGLLFAIPRLAGQITHYRCDFEDAAENAQWTLNPICGGGITIEQLGSPWYIDSATDNGGTNCLYVSKDDGESASFANGCTVIAYRELQLDAGDYELSFDWLTGASGQRDILFVGWMPENSEVNGQLCSLSTNLGRPAYLDSCALIPQGGMNDSLSAASWKTSVFPFVADGGLGKLFFVWRNQPNTASIKGACVDNIYIKPAGGCPMPDSLAVEVVGAQVVLDWQGEEEATFDVKCYSYATDSWQEFNDVTEQSLTFYGMQSGQTDFYVRTVCVDETSHWKQITELLYFPEKGCVDYLQLSDENCWTGKYVEGQFRPTLSSPIRGKVDYGSGDRRSRHTIFMTQGEYDPNTNYGLPTIPPGELASVRLGNDLTNAEAEMIEYSFIVDADVSSVLLLKYAVVLQNPPHDEDQQPAFTLEVQDEQGMTVPCTYANFSAGFGATQTDQTWHNAGTDSNPILWKEWTTVGVNLGDYDGQQLTIRLSTFDCTETGHYGYAYFTLECTSGEMDGITCGENVTNEFIAPEGFNYRWYLPDDPNNVLSTERTFVPLYGARDTLTYKCDVIFSSSDGSGDCYFTLEASAVPRFPVAAADYELDITGCRNVVTFNNLSHILTENQITYDTTHTALPCETTYWDFGDGTTTMEYSPTHEFPLEGGTYNVKLVSGISDDLCQDSIIIPITLPRLGTKIDTIPLYGCSNNLPFILPDGQQAWATGYFQDQNSGLTQYGCDSLVVYDVTIGDAVEARDTICSDDVPYMFMGDALTQSGTYTAEGASAFGCDSVLHLVVLEDLHVEVPAAPQACADEALLDIAYQVTNGLATDFSLEYLEAGSNLADTTGQVTASPLQIPLPADVRPGHYAANLIFLNADCGNDTVPLNIAIFYPSSVLAQRWNDVLFVQNAEYNGGYEFSGYQWYRNDEPIDGETASYLYVSSGLDQAAEYRVELTRSDDGMTVSTCPVVPYAADNVTLTLASSIVPEGGEVLVSSAHSGTASLYSLSGVLLNRQTLTGGTTSLAAPTQAGYYLLRVELDNGQVKTYHLQIVK